MIDINDNEYFEVITMPGGEPHMKWKNQDDGWTPLRNQLIILLARINCASDLLKLLVITDALKREQCEIHVYIPYFPGARQDRISRFGDALTVKVYADIINAQNYKTVTIVDPHSDVTPSLINNCHIIQVSNILKTIVKENQYDTILIPDAGAAKKIFNYYFPDDFKNRLGLKFVQCLKKRNTETGKLDGFRIVDHIHESARCLVVDDICDGGGTFIGLSNALTEQPQSIVEKIGLFVTHGIFSKGVDELLGTGGRFYFDEIFTTNSIRQKQPEGVKVYNVC